MWCFMQTRQPNRYCSSTGCTTLYGNVHRESFIVKSAAAFAKQFQCVFSIVCFCSTQIDALFDDWMVDSHFSRHWSFVWWTNIKTHLCDAKKTMLVAYHFEQYVPSTFDAYILFLHLEQQPTNKDYERDSLLHRLISTAFKTMPDSQLNVSYQAT